MTQHIMAEERRGGTVGVLLSRLYTLLCILYFYLDVDLGILFFFFSSRRRHTRLTCDWSSDVCSSDLGSDGSRRSFRSCSRSPAADSASISSGCGLRILPGSWRCPSSSPGRMIPTRECKTAPSPD